MKIPTVCFFVYLFVCLFVCSYLVSSFKIYAVEQKATKSQDSSEEEKGT